MISFRFHLVSVSAIFMALALGIVLGTSFINDATIEQVETNARRYRAERDAANDQLGDWTRFVEQGEDAIIEAQLEGVRVLTVVPEGLRGEVVDTMHSLLGRAGAIEAGTVTIDKAWADERPPTDEIAAALNLVGPSTIASVTNAAAERLAREFAAGGGPTLPALIEANVVRLDAGDPATTPGGPARVVVIDNGAPEGLLEPLARALAQEMPKNVLVVNAGPEETVDVSLVVVMRRETDGLEFSTVDHFDTPTGRIAAVLALRDFARGGIGDYGTASGNDRAAPPGG